MVYGLGLILAIILALLSYIDIREFRLPDKLTFPLIFLGFLQTALLGLDIKTSLIGAAAGYISFVAVEVVFKTITGKDGLGRGDAKLLAAGGAWCGWPGLPLIVLIASCSALIAMLFPSMRKLSEAKQIPFGPFLAFGILLVWSAMRFA